MRLARVVCGVVFQLTISRIRNKQKGCGGGLFGWIFEFWGGLDVFEGLLGAWWVVLCRLVPGFGEDERERKGLGGVEVGD